MKVDIENIIVKVKLTEGKLKAIVGLDFGDMVLRGFRIQESQYQDDKGQNQLWVTPPAYQGGGRYHPMVFFPDKELWERIQAKILEAYEKALKTRYTKAFDLSEEDADQLFK